MKTFVFDTETWPIQPGLAAPPLVCMTSVADGNGAVLCTRPELASDTRATAPWEGDGLVVGHNVAFDHAVLLASDFQRWAVPVFRAYEEGRVRDTMHRHLLRDVKDGTLQLKLRDGKKNYGLAAVALDMLGRKVEKADTFRLRYAEVDGLPKEQWPREAVEYALTDAQVTDVIFRAQDNYPDETLQARAGFALRLMSVWGFRVDPVKVLGLMNDLEARIAKCEVAVREVGIVRPNGTRDMKVLQNIIAEACERLGVEVPKTTTGRVSTSEETLLELFDQEAAEDEDEELDHNQDVAPLLRGYLERSKLDKVLTTFVPALLPGALAPINPGYWDIVETGRTSSFNPNVQNFTKMKGVRECITARPGTVFVACDWSGAELVGLAQTTFELFGESAMRDAINKGQDLHLRFGAKLLGKNYGWALANKKSPEMVNARQLAKAANFGFPGGLGALSFVSYARGYGVKLTDLEAKKLKSDWQEEWSEMPAFFRHVASICKDGGPQCIVQPISGRVRGNVRFTSGCNQWFQGRIADAAKDLLWEVIREAYDPRLGGGYLKHFRPIFFIHDEIIGEAPEECAHEVALELQELFVEVLARWCPDVTGAATAHLMRSWSKKAEETYDENGRLIPWEDR